MAATRFYGFGMLNRPFYCCEQNDINIIPITSLVTVRYFFTTLPTSNQHAFDTDG